MTQQTTSDERTNSDSTNGTTGDGTGSDGDRKSHAANQRLEQIRGGLEKAVTGREDVIKAQALKWAEQLDERTQGRHHNKIHVALKVVEFVVDHSGHKTDASDASGARRAASAAGRAGAADAPEDLGEFRNLNDEPKR